MMLKLNERVRIPNLILQFWNEEMLSKIGSYIGKPLVVDSATSSLERMAYARVYVEIDVNWELAEFVPLVDDFWNEFQQKINFEWFLRNVIIANCLATVLKGVSMVELL
ncbi:hypothetical protein Leryth_015847 [Lithospermum erythrorhizon]|nr:hypothetical protein Leryth_015847 [Lithospermum erythrorhizon]